LSIIIDIDHEGGDLTEYTSTSTDSGDLSVAAGAALAGTNYGLSLVIDDATGIYGIISFASPYSTTGIFRGRFYIDPNSLTMANNNNFRLVAINNSALGAVAEIRMGYSNGVGHTIAAMIVDDTAAESFTTYYGITDEPHYVEFNLIRATNDSSADGSIQLWIDGVSKQTVGSKDNYDRFNTLRVVNFGAISGIDAGTSGTFYLDELVVNDDGGEIGPVSTGATGTLGVTLANATTSAAGAVAIDGDANITLGAATLAASGAVAIDGDAAIVLGAATLSAAGAVSSIGEAEGTLAVTLADATCAAVGTVAIAGTALVTLADATLSAAGKVAIDGDLSVTLADAILSATGTVSNVAGVVGTLSVTLANAVVAGVGVVAVAGSGDITLGDATTDGAGAVAIYGQVGIVLAVATLSATGTVTDIATGTGTRDVLYLGTRDNLELAARATLYLPARKELSVDN